MSENEMKVSENNVGKEILDGWFAESMKALDKVFESAEKIIEKNRKEETK